MASCLYHGVSSLVTLLWLPSCHGGMGGPLLVLADGAASTELSSLSCELCFICVFDMYVFFMCYMSVCFSCVYTCPMVSI